MRLGVFANAHYPQWHHLMDLVATTSKHISSIKNFPFTVDLCRCLLKIPKICLAKRVDSGGPTTNRPRSFEE